jgi:hypothetical protein
MHALPPALASAVDTLYAVFARYTAEGLNGYPYPERHGPSEFLLAKSLRKLGGGDLSEYACRAMTTWGSIDDFKHFVPRLMELVGVEGTVGDGDVEIVLGKFGYGKWTRWPAREREAVAGFFDALWRTLLETYPHPLSADEFLCGVGNSVPDVSPYLARWAADGGLPASLHLAAFAARQAEHNSRKRPPMELANAHWLRARWEPPNDNARIVWDWLMEPARVEQLERAFFARGDGDPDGAISDAVSKLAFLQQVNAARA